MMSNPNKIKGYKLEHFIEVDLNNSGIASQRLAQANQEDILIRGKEKLECKVRKSGLKKLYDWLGDNNYLAIKWQSPQAKNKDILVVMRYCDFKRFLLK